MKNTKGYIRGYDARTGKRLWIFHTIPQPGEFGNDTWLEKSWEYTGNTGVWTQITVDENLGIAYLPVEDPTGDYFGGHRPGNNLFAREPGRRRSADRQAHLALPARSPSDLGLRHSVRADARRHHRRRQEDRRDRAADQAGLHVRVRSQDRRAGVADRRAPGRARHAAARVVFADAALPHQAARVRAQRLHRRHGDRLHAGAEGRGAEDPAGLQDSDRSTRRRSRRAKAERSARCTSRTARTGPAARSIRKRE